MQNYSWQKEVKNLRIPSLYVFSCDLQGKMGQFYAEGCIITSTLMGYKGLYQSQERSEANFVESYMGGDKSEYDVMSWGEGEYIEATDGNMDMERNLGSAVRVFLKCDYYRIHLWE